MSKFCPLPFTHLSLEPSGKVYSCCNTIDFNPLGNIQELSFKEILESENNKNFIKKFSSSNELPNECYLCSKAEELGQISTREASIRQFPEVNREDEKSLTYLSLRFDNICNFSCRICNPFLSTSWYKDAKYLDNPLPEEKIRAFKDDKIFNSFLKNFPTSIKILYFAGGEPLLSKDFFHLINHLITNKMTNIHLIINTNFSTLYYKGHYIPDLLAKFDCVTFSLSIDAIGKLGEYIRNGMNWNNTVNNLNAIKNHLYNFDLKLFPTVSTLNIFSLDKLIKFFISNHLLNFNDIRINPLHEPEYLNISHLPQKIKKDLIKKIRLYAKQIIIQSTNKQDAAVLSTQLIGLTKMLELSDNQKFFKEFIKQTRQLDNIRNQSILDVVPELKSFFIDCED